MPGTELNGLPVQTILPAPYTTAWKCNEDFFPFPLCLVAGKIFLCWSPFFQSSYLKT